MKAKGQYSVGGAARVAKHRDDISIVSNDA